MKKYLSVFLALLLMLVLVSCDKTQPTTVSKEPTVPTTQTKPQQTQPTTAPTTAPTQPTTVPTEPVHVHTPSEEWTVDKDNHWQLCTDCGQVMNESAHSLDVVDVCRQCLSEIYSFDFGTVLTQYDDQGNSILEMFYDTDGNLETCTVWVYTYDEAGNILLETETVDGVIVRQATYAPDPAGGTYLSKETQYNDDGSWDEYEYDVWYNQTLWVSYAPDGSKLVTIRNVYECDDAGNTLLQKTFEDDVLTSEIEYAYADTLFGSYTYPAKETTYYPDGSRLITEYNEDFEVISTIYLDANGNPVDHSGKFNPDTCAPLFGTWEGSITMDGSLFDSAVSEMQVAMRLTFRADGTLLAHIDIDPQQLISYMVETLYATYEEMGLTREEADALMLQQMGMTVEAYAQQMLSSGEMSEMLQQEFESVYYVEGNQLYMGENWTSHMEGTAFLLNDNVLTLFPSDEDPSMPQMVVLTKVDAPENNSGKFDPDTCAPLFGTWEGEVLVPGAEMELPTDIRCHLLLTFHKDGRMDCIISLNQDDVKAATIEKLYQTFEMMGMTRDDADAAFLANAGMTIEAYVDAMLNSDEADIPLVQSYSGVYYIADGMLYGGEHWDDTMLPTPFLLDGSFLTISDPETEISCTLTKTESDSSNSVINADDFTGDLSNWETDADDLIEIVDGKLHFNTNFPGDYCAAMLKQPIQNGTFRFTLTVNALSENYTEFWWDTELIIIARASRPGPSWYDDRSQTGYTISSWGDLSEFCLGRCGYDDAFGVFSWNINDGQSHVIEITTINNADNTAVEVIVTVDGEEIARVVDDGTLVKKERPNLYPDAGNLVIRAKWMEITIG